MKKPKEVRIHKQVGDRVSSVYFCKHNDKLTLQTEDFSYSTTDYWQVGICTSKTRRGNNDWWNGKKSGNKFDNRSIGNTKAFLECIRSVKEFIEEKLLSEEFVVLEIDGSDERRKNCYNHILERFARKSDLTITRIGNSNFVIFEKI